MYWTHVQIICRLAYRNSKSLSKNCIGLHDRIPGQLTTWCSLMDHPAQEIHGYITYKVVYSPYRKIPQKNQLKWKKKELAIGASNSGTSYVYLLLVQDNSTYKTCLSYLLMHYELIKCLDFVVKGEGTKDNGILQTYTIPNKLSPCFKRE